jgi:hypothetical protein
MEITTLSDLDLWSMLAGFFMPALIATIVQSHWASQLKAAVTAGVCALGGGVTAALTGYLHGVSIVRAVLIVLGSALAFYRLFWKPSKIAGAIEAATDLPR